MRNMSYCRFQNTLSDLRDCYRNLSDQDLDKSEKEAKEEIIKLCKTIAKRYNTNKRSKKWK